MFRICWFLAWGVVVVEALPRRLHSLPFEVSRCFYSPSAAAGARGGGLFLPASSGRYAIHCLATQITSFLRSQKWEFAGVHQRPVRPCLLPFGPFFGGC